MLLLRLSLTCVCVLTVPVTLARVTTDTVVGVAGRRVMLPCRAEAVGQPGVEVCWGRGEPSLFTCHNTVLNTAGEQTTYRKSKRYSSSSSSSSSLFILNTRTSDSGFYHCRVQLSGLFNDQTSTVHLIVIQPRPVVSEPTDREDAGNLDSLLTTPDLTTGGVTEPTGNDITGGSFTEPVLASVQSSVQKQEQTDTLQIFIGNTLRASLIIFIPALMLTAAHRVWRANRGAEKDKRLDQSEEEEEEESSV